MAAAKNVRHIHGEQPVPKYSVQECYEMKVDMYIYFAQNIGWTVE